MQAQGFTPEGSGGQASGALIGIIVGSLVAVLLIVLVVCWLVKRKDKKERQGRDVEGTEEVHTEPATSKGMLNRQQIERDS